MNKDEFYNNLKNKLEEQFQWPQPYLFKFIIPSANDKLALLKSLFGEEAQITIRQSRNNKYTSVSIKELMLSPDEVISVYRKAEKIEGIISL